MMRFITNPKWWISPNIKYNFYSRYFLFVAFHFLFTKTFRSRPVWCAQSDRSLLARNQNQFGIRRGPEGENKQKSYIIKTFFVIDSIFGQYRRTSTLCCTLISSELTNILNIIQYLSSALSSAELSALDEARVPIRSDDSVIQPRAVDVPESALRVFSLKSDQQFIIQKFFWNLHNKVQ